MKVKNLIIKTIYIIVTTTFLNSFNLISQNCIVNASSQIYETDDCTNNAGGWAPCSGNEFVFHLRTPAGQLRYYSNLSLNWTQMDDGTASLVGDVRDCHNNEDYHLDVSFSGYTKTPSNNSPHAHGCHQENASEWYYYPNFSGTFNSLSTSFTTNLTSDGPAFQVGYDANGVERKKGRFGASGWFVTDDATFVSGDMNFNLDLIPGAIGDIACNCNNNSEELGGTYDSHNGVSGNPGNAGGMPDGNYTGNISGNNDYLVLTYPDLLDGDEICVSLYFTSSVGIVNMNLNGNNFRFSNVTTERGVNNPQVYCIPVTSNGVQTLTISDGGSGRIRVDGSTSESCGACDLNDALADCDGDGVVNGEDSAPEDPCTADGTTDGEEPQDWSSLPSNDCDDDGITSDIDQDDYDNCIDENGTVNSLFCQCGDNTITAGGTYDSHSGVGSFPSRADGAPDGSTTGSVSNNDYIILTYPYVSDGGQICITAGFDKSSGAMSVEINGEIQVITNPTGLGSWTQQEMCIDVTTAGPQTIKIKDAGSGNMRVDGSTYISCPECDINDELADCDGDGVVNGSDVAPEDPCTADGIADGSEPPAYIAQNENDCDGDGISAEFDQDDYSNCVDENGQVNSLECQCEGELVTGGGTFDSHTGVRSPRDVSDGEPDGVFTGQISGNDNLYLTYDTLVVGAKICVTVRFSSPNGRVNFQLNTEPQITFDNPGSANSIHEFCINVTTEGTQILRIRDGGSGNLRVDGSTFTNCEVEELEPGFIETVGPPEIVEKDSLGEVNLAHLAGLVEAEVTGNTAGIASNNAYQISETGSVLITVIAQPGQLDKAIALLDSLGMTDISYSPDYPLTLTGFLPCINAFVLDFNDEVLLSAETIPKPIVDAGLVTSQGDRAQRSDFIRGGFNLTGDGVKIGVISDSYDQTNIYTTAALDIANGDLPANGVQKLPDSSRFDNPTDEGRAMLQIIHDVAPGADLAFKTGFVDPANFAKSIRELADADCDIIVDDVTWITEPFFTDGAVARSVDSVVSEGVTYVSAAGNYGPRAYGSSFVDGGNIASIGSAELTSKYIRNSNARVHSFGTSNQQKITLQPGEYTFALHWDEPVISLDGNNGGAVTDLDFYIVNNDGSLRFFINSREIGRDPNTWGNIKVGGDLDVETNIVIVNASGSNAVDFKYIFFRGAGVSFDETPTDTASIVGQANAEGAIAVGAVLYLNTPEFGKFPSPASFSSRGGQNVQGVNRMKPDIMAPNGGNTTIELGGVAEIDGNDGFPNFSGTSAAAPHAAAAIALLYEARKKYLDEETTPELARNLIAQTALDMGDPGYDPSNGLGFIQPDKAVMTFANPSPIVMDYEVPSGTVVGTQPFEVMINADYITDETMVIFGTDTLSTDISGDSMVMATIPVFANSTQAVQLYTPPMTESGIDGGMSNSFDFTAPVKPVITITANSETRNYGE